MSYSGCSGGRYIGPVSRVYFKRTGRSGANRYVYNITRDASDTSVATVSCGNFSISFLGSTIFNDNGNKENIAILYELKGFIKANKEIFGTYTGTLTKLVSDGSTVSQVESGTFKAFRRR